MTPIDRDDAVLRSAITDFLAASGRAPTALGADALLCRDRDGRLSGVVHPPAEAPDAMARALGALAALREAGVAAESAIPVVKRGRAGLNRAEIAASGGSPLTPAQFFDWHYRRRGADDEDASPLSDRLRRKVRDFRIHPRAPQPYRRLAALAPNAAPVETGRDLFDRLAPDFAAAPAGPRLIVLCGPAGVGKSVLTAELLNAAHGAFNAAKNRDALGARPILFEPVELGSTADTAPEIRSFRRLVDALFGAEIARDVPPSAFAWLHRMGLNTWILDGLDEFFRRQTDFFATIAQTLDAPESRAQILMSTRDSLFASSDALRAFLEERLDAQPEATEIYELERWDAAAKRAYIAAVLAAEQGEAGRPQIDAIAAKIEGRSDLAELSDLPFYCSRLVAAIRKGEERALRDEFALLQFTIDAIVDREVVEKQVMRLSEFVADFDREDIAADVAAKIASRMIRAEERETALAAALEARGRAELEDMLGLAAFLYLFAEPEPAASLDGADWVDGVLPTLIAPELDEAAASRLELALAHFPLFGRGEDEGAQSGKLRFVHRLVAEYLASTYATNLVRSNPGSARIWEMALGKRRDWEETVFFRRLRAELGMDAELKAAAEARLRSGALGKSATQRIMALLAA